jgi:NADPH:quinone reductase-like Zn-dependent oxidoreductase
MAARVNAITNGKGANIVFDPVSGSYLEQLADIVAPEGLIVEYGWLDTSAGLRDLFCERFQQGTVEVSTNSSLQFLCT